LFLEQQLPNFEPRQVWLEGLAQEPSWLMGLDWRARLRVDADARAAAVAQGRRNFILEMDGSRE
jgi:hypothetical protein